MKMDGLYLAASINFGQFPLPCFHICRNSIRPPLMPSDRTDRSRRGGNRTGALCIGARDDSSRLQPQSMSLACPSGIRPIGARDSPSHLQASLALRLSSGWSLTPLPAVAAPLRSGPIVTTDAKSIPRAQGAVAHPAPVLHKRRNGM